MLYRPLGTSGLKVSELGLGSWLTYGGAYDFKQSEAIIDKAYDLGINLFDTANVYMRGGAEEVVGKALAKYPRHTYVLATKVCVPMGEGPNDRGLSRKHIREQCDASLRRLGVDYIDLYQCHRYDPETPMEETLRALDDLVKQGKILYAGVSMWGAADISNAFHLARELRLNPIVSNQPQYSMLMRGIEKEILPVCERLGIGQIVYSPLAQGVLTGKYKTGRDIPQHSRASDPLQNGAIARFLKDETLNKVERIAVIAERNGWSMAQLAVAWNLRQANVASCIIGASRPDQVELNVSASGIRLKESDLHEIESILCDEEAGLGTSVGRHVESY